MAYRTESVPVDFFVRLLIIYPLLVIWSWSLYLHAKQIVTLCTPLKLIKNRIDTVRWHLMEFVN